MNPNQVLIDSGWKFVISVSGGGQEILGDLTRYGGMSSTLLEGIVPYSLPAYHALVRGKPDKIVSPEAARAAAVVCYERAVRFARGERVFGFASTGAVVRVDGEREGRRHRVYMALQDHERTVGIDLEYGPGRTRAAEEDLTAKCILAGVHWGCHLFADFMRVVDYASGDRCVVKTHVASAQMQDLFHHRIKKYDTGPSRAIFSSAFNPIHDGHLAIIADASKRLGCPVDLELCICNADKPALDYLTLHERVQALQKATNDNPHVGNIIPTDEPYFFEKSSLFPGAWFVMGSDTFDRIHDPAYYPNGHRDIEEGILRLMRNRNRILLYPRKGCDTSFIDIDDPRWQYAGLVTVAKDFEASDASSTKIRQEMASA
jgi:nicotinic acid mononucleotide adenylyltransferase